MRPRFMVTFVRFTLMSLMAVAVSKPAHAWPHDPVSGNRPVSTVPGLQQNVQMLPDGTGGAFFVWEDYRSGNEWDLYGAYVNAQGLDPFPEFLICAAPGDQRWPSLCSDGAGGFIVSWEDGRVPTADIFAQRFSATGAPQWAANGVAVCEANDMQERPVITTDGNGGAIVAWMDRRSGDYDIYARGISAGGSAEWADGGVALSVDPFDQWFPTIASDSYGGAIVAWQDLRNGNSDIYAQRVAGGGLLFLNGGALCTAAGDQTLPVAAPDGVSGAIIAWTDARSGDRDVYAGRLTRTGTFAWTNNGVLVSGESGDQQLPVVVTDGAAGSFIAWTDSRAGNFDVYAQKLSVGGGPMWWPGGVQVSTEPEAQRARSIVDDGMGGAIIAWDDDRYPGTDVYAQRFGPEGYSRWEYRGQLISGALDEQASSVAIADGRGGAILGWIDTRNNGDRDIYAQRVDAFGKLGDAAPGLVKVRDIPNDQGGHVKLWWDGSYLDAAPYFEIGEYRILRSVAPHRAAQLMRAAAIAGSHTAAAPEIVVTQSDGLDYYWELIAVVPPLALSRYSYVAATTSDSVGTSNPRTVFMVQARSANGIWNSAPDSGYSVDNLPPATPSAFAGRPQVGSNALHWVPNTEPDAAAYRLYRGATADFVPSPTTMISDQPDTGFVDHAPVNGETFYKLSAVDAHGNESPFAAISVPRPVGVGSGSTAGVLLLAPPQPNPARYGAMIRWRLPAAGRASIEILDAQGRRVRTLAREHHPAGESSVHWDCRNDSGGSVANGLYFIRLVTDARTISARLLIVR